MVYVFTHVHQLQREDADEKMHFLLSQEHFLDPQPLRI